MARIAFIGLGNMGAPMAANLVKAGHEVVGYDRNATALASTVAFGVTPAASPGQAAKGAGVIITMLPAGEHVREVWLHQGGLVELAHRDGTQPLLIDCSTIDVASARVVEEAARTVGLDMLDAPVSGGTAGATAGTLTFMVGGSDAAFARGEQVLRAMGKNIFHAGAAGAGQSAKICNNMMLAINMVGACEGFLLAKSLGLDWNKLHQIAVTSSGQSWALSSYCPAPGPVPAAPSNRDYAPGFMAQLMLKDISLSQVAAEAGDVATPLASHAMTFYQAAVDAGDGAKDFSVVFRLLSKRKRREA
jgi:3-hydroxyisobutyrate dehydrogenase